MPSRPGRPCATPGCSAIVRGGHCSKHRPRIVAAQAEAKREIDARRGTAAARGYGSRWQKARVGYLRKHPLCTECDRLGYTTPATEVDHEPPHRGDMAMFWDSATWQGLCKACHSRKTMREVNARRLHGAAGKGGQIPEP